MDTPALISAAYWGPLLENIADIAFVVVILALAVELGAGRFAKHFQATLDRARESQIAELQHQTEQLKNENLRLQERLAPRRIKDEAAFLKALEGHPAPKSFHILYVDEADSAALANQLFSLLLRAGWQAKAAPRPIGVHDAKYPNIAGLAQLTVAAGGQPTGVSVVGRRLAAPQDPPVMDALGQALLKALGRSAAGTDENMPSGELRVVVAPKE